MIQNNEQANFEGENGTIATEITEMSDFSDEKALLEKKYKRGIKIAALTVGLPFFLLVLFSVFWRKTFLFVVDNIGISRKSVSLFLKSSINQDFISILISVFMFIFVFSLCIKLFGKRISDLIPLGKPKKGTFFPLVIAGAAFCLFSNILNLEFENFFESFGTKYNVTSTKPDITLLSFIISVISTAMIPALVEEYACRGIIFGTLLPYGEGFALLTSSIVFGIMHGNFEQMPFAFLVGLILGYVRIKSGSIWPCILIHFMNNVFSVVSEFSGYILPGKTRDTLYFIFIVSVLLAGLIAALLFTQKEDALALQKNTPELKESKKYKWFFTSPVIIIPIIGYFVLSLKYFR